MCRSFTCFIEKFTLKPRRLSKNLVSTKGTKPRRKQAVRGLTAMEIRRMILSYILSKDFLQIRACGATRANQTRPKSRLAAWIQMITGSNGSKRMQTVSSLRTNSFQNTLSSTNRVQPPLFLFFFCQTTPFV